MKKFLLSIFLVFLFPLIANCQGVPGFNNQVIVQPDANDTYVCFSGPGTAQSTASWTCYYVKINGTTTTITWANGSARSQNVATNPAGLSYS